MKRIKLLLVVFLTGVILVGCSSSKLSDVYDENTLKSKAKETVNLFINEEYDKIAEQMSDNMKNSAKPEEFTKQLKEIWDSSKGKLGKFEKISKEGVVGNGDLATVIEVAKFENGKVQFTITYNENMELDGFYIK